MARKLLLVLTAAAVLAPLAEAQQNTATTLVIQPPASTYEPASSHTIPGKLQVTMDVTGIANTAGIPVYYLVTKEPAWATVTVTPETDVLYPPSVPTPGLTVSMEKTFVVTVDLAKNATPDDIRAVEITAVVQPMAPAAKGASARESFAVHVASPPAAAAPAAAPRCPDNGAPAAAATTATTTAPPAAGSGSQVHVQSAAATPTSAAVAVGGLGAVGAGVALLVRRRF